MFRAAVDPTSLKQGDIVRDIIFPIARIDNSRILSKATGTAAGRVTVEAVVDGTPERPHLAVQVQGNHVPCAVLSQCCDVEPKQSPPPHSFVLCRLSPVPKSITRHRASLEMLRANVDPYGEGKAFTQLFWFGAVPGLDGEFMADFAQVMTVSWNDYDQVLGRKIAELDDLHRAMFRVKAGGHFGRAAAEDVAAGYGDPYTPTDAPGVPRTLYRQKFIRALRLLAGRD